MKYMFVAVLSLSLSLAAMAQTTHVKIMQSGSFASVSGNPDAFSTFSLTVSMNSSNASGTNTSINYLAFSVAQDFSSETFTSISGAIPDSDFTGQNTQNMTVSIDTSTLDPTLVIISTCTINFSDFTETCTSTSPGTIQLSFQQNSANRTQVLNLQEVITNGGMTTRIHQNSDTSSANVTGTVFGVQVNTATGTVGTQTNSSLESTFTP